MPFALIPDGYSLKQVTKLQKQAVDDKRRHDDVVALLNNPTTPTVVGAAIATILGVRFTEDLVAKLREEFGAFTEEQEQKVKSAVDSVNPVKRFEKAVRERSVSGDITSAFDTALEAVRAKKAQE